MPWMDKARSYEACMQLCNAEGAMSVLSVGCKNAQNRAGVKSGALKEWGACVHACVCSNALAIPGWAAAAAAAATAAKSSLLQTPAHCSCSITLAQW